MKKSLALLFLLVVLGHAHAQGTLQFTAHLTSTLTDATGDGTFSLTGNLFTYDVQTYPGFQIAEIQGPGPGTNAPVIFSLDLRRCEAPGPGLNSKCYFQGDFALSDSQIAEVVSDQWYVNAFSSSAPSHVLRGEIIQVPDASSMTMLALAIGFGYLWFWRQPARTSLG